MLEERKMHEGRCDEKGEKGSFIHGKDEARKKEEIKV